MNKLFGASMLAVLIGSTGAIAQTVPPVNSPAGSPTATEKMSPPAASTAPMSKEVVTLTEAQAKAWIKKSVYSSDGKNVGEVTAINRDATGKVINLQVGIGGFLGIGETLVTLAPTQFKLGTDRIELSVSAADVKTLPKSLQ